MHLIYVHIGKTLPYFLIDNLIHTRTITSIQIYVLISKNHIKSLPVLKDVHYKAIEDIKTSVFHKEFVIRSGHNREFRDGFCVYTSERFFTLYDFCKQENLTDIFHIENDNLIYQDFAEKIDTFRKKEIWATFDNENRCIPGFMYFKNSESLKNILFSFVKYAPFGTNDMVTIAHYKKENPDMIGMLPIIADYCEEISKEYYEYAKEFGCLFDAACIGQFIGGVDPRNKEGDTCGFVNEESIVKGDKVKIEWKDNKPYVNEYPMINLHIHSKDLKRWMIIPK
jgi:hypothetical protein